MTYKAKFEASEQRALYQGIATKILREMNDLRSKAQDSPTVRRRWIWELIQNAKDVHYSSGVDIQIDLRKTPANKLIFKHNGKPFSADNIRFLIEQISSKDRTKDDEGKRKTTGKFGTGFLATHLLSEVVTVSGVAKEHGLDYRKFKFTLDRTGFELDEITDAVQKAKDSILNLDDFKPYNDYAKEDFNTSFTYPLNDNLSIEIAKAGIDDLYNCLPYVLLFVDKINGVELLHTYEKYNKPKATNPNDEISFITIDIDNNDSVETNQLEFAKITSGFTSIAIPVKTENDTVEIIQIDSSIPKLFCDFPLVGTEIFPFPAIINNPNFNPTDPRDGVFLNNIQQRPNPTVEENKVIIGEAIKLYYKLLDFAVANKWKNLHLLANLTNIKDAPAWLNNGWYNESVLKPIKNKILHANIVDTANGKLSPILNEQGKSYIWFPWAKDKKAREFMWKLASEWFPSQLPKETDVELWHKLAWPECGKLAFDLFAGFVESKKTLDEFDKVLSLSNAENWLNDFYSLLQMDEKEFHSIIEKRAIIPDQNGDFWKKDHLYQDAGNIEDELKDILKELGSDIRSRLMNSATNLKLSADRLIDQSYVVKEIISEVTAKTTDRDVAQNFRGGLNRLLLYFRSNPEKSKKLFPAIYKNKHLLYDDEEILDNISKAEELDDLLKDFKVKTTEDLRALLENKTEEKNSLLPVTQEILLSMGITSIQEWQDALKDRNLKELFSHTSVPTEDMFVYAQSHIATAKKNVIEHLTSQEEYDLSELDDSTAPTILAGILKHEMPISIVVRPAYKNEVIIYYGSERDILDYEPSELWVDTGSEIKQVTLGHILKTAEIRKFPI